MIFLKTIFFLPFLFITTLLTVAAAGLESPDCNLTDQKQSFKQIKVMEQEDEKRPEAEPLSPNGNKQDQTASYRSLTPEATRWWEKNGEEACGCCIRTTITITILGAFTAASAGVWFLADYLKDKDI